MKCSECQHENRSGAKFCEECASPVARTCANCGSQLSATAKFCPACAYGVAAVTPGGRLASPEFYTPKDLLGWVTSEVASKGKRKQVTEPFADMKDSIERASDQMPTARPSSLREPPGPTVAATPPMSAMSVIGRTPVIHSSPVIPAMSKESEPSRRALPETSRAQASGIPWIAIGTGAALVALLLVALYTWLPTTPRAPGDTAAAVVPAAGAAKTRKEPSEPSNPAPKHDDPANSAPQTPRDADRPNAPPRTEEPSLSIRTSFATRPSAAAAALSESASGTLRNPGKTAALGSGSLGARDHAERARSRMTAARLAAERVAAGFYASNRFLSAQTKEREGVAALSKSAYVTASALFAEAQSEYQVATAEAPLEEQNQRKLAALRTSLDQTHAAVATRRQQALAAKADELAKELFDQAQAQQVEGDTLASRKDFAAATRAYQEATARYGEATERARAAPPAK